MCALHALTHLFKHVYARTYIYMYTHTAIIRDVVGAAFVKLARSIEKRGRRPSPTVMKLLGIYSGDEEVDFARAKCVALAYSQGAGPFSAIHVTGWWFQAKGAMNEEEGRERGKGREGVVVCVCGRIRQEQGNGEEREGKGRRIVVVGWIGWSGLWVVSSSWVSGAGGDR